MAPLTPSGRGRAPAMIVRRYEARDADAVRGVHAEAFRRDDAAGPPAEVALVARLEADGDVIPQLSLVAVVGGEIVGHVVCSRARVGDVDVAGLGPIGVLPGRQGEGVGSALVHTALGAADALGLPLVGLLGAPAFYARFGFVPGAALGIAAPDPTWGDAFQVRALSAYASSVVGAFRYAPAFDGI